MSDKYLFTVEDFPTRFHKILFACVEYLGKNGADNITPLLIDEHLSKFPKQYAVFTANNGLQYIERMLVGFENNFDISYASLKKCSLLNKLYESGIDISEFYNPNTISIDESTQVNERFQNTTAEQILSFYQGKLTDIEAQFNLVAGRESIQAGLGLAELKEELKKAPEFGAPMNSKKMATICRGRRRKKFYLKTAASGAGKSRLSLADACLISIPKRYDPDMKKWIKTPCSEPTLFITTELEKDEVQTMIMAYVSCVPEDHILDGKYEDGQERRVDKAIKIISEAPLWIEHIGQFDVDDIEKVITEHKRKHGITMVMFDYLFLSTKTLMEMSRKSKGISIREDNVLALFSDRLKTLCNKLDIHIDSSTQANGDWKNVKDPDQNIIRGSKAIADKIDVGYCILPVSQADQEGIKSIMQKKGSAFLLEPNLVYHIYKVRRGKLNHVKLFLNFDYSTLRTTDLFATDKDYKLLDIEGTDIETLLDETEEEKPKLIQNPDVFQW